MHTMVKERIEKKQTMKLQLGDVETTALIPLSNCASEAKRKNPRVCNCADDYVP